MDNNKKNNKVILCILGLLIILVAALLCLLILNKGKTNNGEKTKDTGLLGALQNTKQVTNIPSQKKIKITALDQPISVLKNKENLFGAKLSSKGNYTSICSIGNIENDNEYEIKVIDEEKQTLGVVFKNSVGENTVNLGITNEDKDIKAIYNVTHAGCDSSLRQIFIVDHGTYITEVSDNSSKISKLNISHSYKMFYSISLDTTLCDVACNEHVTTYLIGETNEGDMYVLSSEGEILIDEVMAFDAEFYQRDPSIELNVDTYIYGETIKHNDTKIIGLSE